jgi:hypothetical protein
MPQSDKIFDDVFEAIRQCEPDNPLLNLKANRQGILRRRISFNAMGMPDGSIGAFPINMSPFYYRGENNNYESCFPNIYRCCSEEQVVINKLKIIDFSNVVKTFPQYEFAIKDFANVDPVALAQHYDLRTDLIDISSDIGVSAFFATSKYDEKSEQWKVINDGLGCIRKVIFIPVNDASFIKFKMIGLQPFKRPGVQCAFAVKLKNGEDFANQSFKIVFKQNKHLNGKIFNAFHENGKNILFPNETISEAANIIKRSKYVSDEALKIYCYEEKIEHEEVKCLLKKHNILTKNSPLYALSRQQKKECRIEYKDKPYGDVEIRSRLCCRSN